MVRCTWDSPSRPRNRFNSPCPAPFPPLSSATDLLDLGVGTAVENEPLGHGRHGAGVFLIAGAVEVDLYTAQIIIQRVVLTNVTRDIEEACLSPMVGPQQQMHRMLTDLG